MLLVKHLKMQLYIDMSDVNMHFFWLKVSIQCYLMDQPRCFLLLSKHCLILLKIQENAYLINFVIFFCICQIFEQSYNGSSIFWKWTNKGATEML